MDQQHSREQLWLALELAQVGFYDWDVINDRITYSPQMLKDWGMHSSESRPLTEVIKLIHPEDQERVSNSSLRRSTRGNPTRLNTEL